MIYFLDDDITFTFTPNVTGYKSYTIAIDNTYNIVFNGNVYCVANKPMSINVNDIVSNYRLIEKLSTKFGKESHQIESRFTVILKVENVVYSSIVVCPVYRYPNKRYDKFLQDAWQDTHDTIDVLTLLQTTEFRKVVQSECLGKTKVLPHIPFKRTDKYGFQHCYFLEMHNEKTEDEVDVYWYLGNTLVTTFDDLDWGNSKGYSNKANLNTICKSNIPYSDTLYMTHNDLSSTSYEPTLNTAKYWSTTTKSYVVKASMYSNKTITFGAKADYLQIGLIDDNSTYQEIQKYSCDGDSHTYIFKYDSQKHYFYEFSFRDNGQIGAKNNEIAFVQFKLTGLGLIDGEEYRINFTHKYDGTNTIISNISLVNDTFTAIAKVDECPARYYLMWQDRLGGIQSQGFDGKSEFSESFVSQSIENYSGHKRTINTQVQPKLNLNTKQLTEEEYPIYESIFVSPYVLLYDVDSDVSYNVVPTGKTYTEKTWKNQKKAYNFNLEVELDKKQNMFA